MNVLAMLLAASLASPQPEFTAQTVDGREIRGTLIAWDGAALQMQSGDRQEKIELDQLLGLANGQARPAVPPVDTTWVTLADGSVIAAQSCLAEADKVTVTATRPARFELPRASIGHVRFYQPTAGQEKRWQEILQREIDQDLLAVIHGDTLDYLEGVVRRVREEDIEFELDGEVLPVRRSKVFAVRFYHPAGGEEFRPVARLADDAGSVWSAQRIEISQSGQEIVVETPLGVRVALPLEAVVRVEFAGAGVVFLGDLEPDSSRWTHYLGPETNVPSLEKLYRPRRNMALDSGPLMLDGVRHPRGLALHSRTEMTYRLGEPFERLQALAGIDDRLRPRGNVRLKILGDDRVLYDGTITGTEKARAIDVGVKGVKTLTILVDFGAGLDVGDDLILAEAKLLK
ncbi:MAG: NPCBM/NEW2 domain-containing protein [Thermoguttaceae bacterium]